MLSGANESERTRYRLSEKTSSDDFSYTRVSGGLQLRRGHDSEAWEQTKAKLDVCGVSHTLQPQLFELLAAVLHLGEVTTGVGSLDREHPLASTPIRRSMPSGEGESAEFKEGEMLPVAAMLQVDLGCLKDALTHRLVVSGRGSSYSVPLTAQQRRAHTCCCPFPSLRVAAPLSGPTFTYQWDHPFHVVDETTLSPSGPHHHHPFHFVDETILSPSEPPRSHASHLVVETTLTPSEPHHQHPLDLVERLASLFGRVDTRDALAKAIYALLFDWLILQLNQGMRPQSEGQDGAAAELDDGQVRRACG